MFSRECFYVHCLIDLWEARTRSVLCGATIIREPMGALVLETNCGRFNGLTNANHQRTVMLCHVDSQKLTLIFVGSSFQNAQRAPKTTMEK